MSTRRSRFGQPLPAPRSRSKATTLIVEPTMGFVVSQPPTDLPPGASPKTVNWVFRDGAMEPRPRVSLHTNTPNPLSQQVLGGSEIVSSVDSRYNFVAGTLGFAWYSNSSYSPLSFVSAAGSSITPSGTTLDHVEIVQIYEPRVDDMVAIASYTSSHQTLYTWQAGTTIYSNLTSAPRARHLAVLDNFVLAGNIRDVGSAQSRYIQRVQWSDRGNPSNWTTGVSGFEDLLDAGGDINRMMTQDNRVVLFFDDEIWTGQRGAFPSVFDFAPIDRTVGTNFGATCALTPAGIMFMSNDYRIYLLPKEGGAAREVAQSVGRTIRDEIDNPTSAWAIYDQRTDTYQLNYAVRGGTSLPQRALWVDIGTGSVAPQAYDQVSGPRSFTAGWSGLRAGGEPGLTWSNLSGVYTWSSFPFTWSEMLPTSTYGDQSIYMGSSDGTVYYFNPSADSDDGTLVEACWRSHAIGADTPEHVKSVNGFRLDYSAAASSAVTVRFSRDMGETFDQGQSLTLVQADNQMVATGHPYSTGRYPLFEVCTESSFLRLYRFWIASRIGGR